MKTWGEFEAASCDEQLAEARRWLAEWEQNYRYQCQADAEDDQRAFLLGIIDESPIDAPGQYTRSGTTRSETT